MYDERVPAAYCRRRVICPKRRNAPAAIRDARISARAACTARHIAKNGAKKPLRGGAAARGYDAHWRKARSAYLKRHPLCAELLDKAAHSRPATVVDHILPHRGNDALFWDEKNWQPSVQGRAMTEKREKDYNYRRAIMTEPICIDCFGRGIRPQPTDSVDAVCRHLLFRLQCIREIRHGNHRHSDESRSTPACASSRKPSPACPCTCIRSQGRRQRQGAGASAAPHSARRTQR